MSINRKAIFKISVMVSLIFSTNLFAIVNICNDKEVRKLAMANINGIIKDKNLTAIDVYDGKTLKIEPTICEYTIKLNTTEVYRIRYEEKENSFGELIVELTQLD